MKSTDQEVNLAKSSDQQVVQTGDKHNRGAILSKPAFIRLFWYNIKQSRTFHQAIKVNFCQSEVLIPVVNCSTGPM